MMGNDPVLSPFGGVRPGQVGDIGRERVPDRLFIEDASVDSSFNLKRLVLLRGIVVIRGNEQHSY
jgi:hypothetical protein